MSNKQEIEQLIAEMKLARESGDDPAADRIQKQLNRIAKHDEQLAGTITAMLATL
jgi:hypothetical protein